MAKNLLSQLGIEGFTDEDYQIEYGVSPEDPEFNKKIFDIIENKNIDGYLEEGYTIEKARHMAAERKAKAIAALPGTVKK